MAVESPHLDLPFTLGREPNQVEQDSPEDVLNCVTAILSYRLGYLMALPQLGISDPVFRQGGPDLDEIAAAIEEFEDRASATIEDLGSQLAGADSLEDALALIRVSLGSR